MPYIIINFDGLDRKRVLSLILPCGVSFTTPQGPGLLPHYYHRVHLNIGKRIRSNTLSRIRRSIICVDNVGEEKAFRELKVPG
jgi:hypothetical protein